MYFLLFFTTTLCLLWWYFHLPRTISRDIPRIPLYAYIYSIWRNMGHTDMYNHLFRQPLEKHGAVLTWFTGRWCLLVIQPELITDLFRNHEFYPKLGINIRAAGGVLGTFSGNNIINAGRENWATYTSIMRPGIVKNFDLVPIQEKASRFVERLIETQNKSGPGLGILVMPWIAKLTQDVMSLCYFGFDLEALDKARVSYEPLLFELISELFNRWFLDFPILDKILWFLPSRRRAFSNIKRLDSLLDDIVNHTTKSVEKPPKVLSHLLKEALDAGRIDYEQYRSNLRIVFLVGHDNTEFALTSAMWLLGSNIMVQDHLRAEVLKIPCSESPSQALNDLPYLTSVIYEVLRLYPPVAEMINHTVSRSTLLGGKILVHPGTNIGWNSYGVHTNPQFWGPDADKFNPGRWGSTVMDIQANVRRANSKGIYIPFGIHARKCLGQGLAMSEIKITLFELLRRIQWRTDPRYRLKISGGRLAFPVGLKIVVEELK